jgi:hypothetical protein
VQHPLKRGHKNVACSGIAFPLQQCLMIIDDESTLLPVFIENLAEYLPR